MGKHDNNPGYINLKDSKKKGFRLSFGKSESLYETILKLQQQQQPFRLLQTVPLLRY